VTKFKDMNAFEDLKTELSNEIAKNFIARLRDSGVSDEKLNEVTDNVCYDVASVINAVGDLDIPASTNIAEVPEKTYDDLYAMLLEKSDDITAMLEEKTDNFTAMLQEKTHENIEVEDGNSNQEEYQVDGVMTQEKILQILNAAKSTSK
jgi:hypothetical protein